MPLVLAKIGIEELADGEELKVLASDPEASIDIAAWAADQGHAFDERDGDGCAELVLRRGARE